jgi:hypothetical protein
MTRRNLHSLPAAITVASLLAGLVLVASHGVVWPHDAPTGWSYDASCCSGIDCAQAPAHDVKETPAGYTLSTGEVIPYGDHRVRRSKDEFFHECKPGGDMSSRHSFCLYVPDRGF